MLCVVVALNHGSFAFAICGFMSCFLAAVPWKLLKAPLLFSV